MAKNLVIVESPTKAKTIAGFLGSGYEVKCSFGHIRDLPKKDLGVDISKQFRPTYEISPDKQKIVNELKKASKNKVVWLASDEDREGEAIAWHIAEVLGVDPKTTKRIVFHEITKPAIESAITKPRTVDMKLVDAQQARRILDRLVGYELSPVLWKKVKAGLSAGRVQSVAVRLVVEREREIKKFEPKSSFKITATLKSGTHQLEAGLPDDLQTEDSARKFLQDSAKANFTVESVEQKPGTRSPSAPFTTSTLQQEAARRLGFSVRQTMTLAQRLYEHGHITYMRTDSTNLSPLALKDAESYITKRYGDRYSKPTQYRTKTAGAQEAHEAIRPTHASKEEAGADSAQKKLYNLIWRRTLASQMAPAELERTEIRIALSNRKERLLASGEVLLFDGFYKVYGTSKEDQILPPVKNGDKLNLESMQAMESFSRPKGRYSEASLVRRLEELGIGRPSTYAPTISTIQDRGYIEKKDVEGRAQPTQLLSLKDGKITENTENTVYGADRSKLVPTTLAEIVTDFLVKYFGPIVDYDFTAKAESELDDIEEGRMAWQEMLDDFYKQLHPLVKKSESASRLEASQARTLGKDPKSGQPVIVRFGRYGPVLQLGETPDAKDKTAPKPRFAPLPEGAELDTVTLKEALPMFRLPRMVGKTADGEEITANIGRFGPYVQVGKMFVSIKGQDPLTIAEAEARKLIKEKIEAEARKVVADYGKLKVLRGPYGPYVTDGKTNVRVPKDTDPEAITEAKAAKMLAEAPQKPKRSFRRGGAQNG
ncbi:MAG TPA: type I DNA topoisomerase [Candidatus Saccharimonadales bacterium]|nr:type I DNA topoisomerase [Candidatus Saccharimonadales bacterium]